MSTVWSVTVAALLSINNSQDISRKMLMHDKCTVITCDCVFYILFIHIPVQ